MSCHFGSRSSKRSLRTESYTSIKSIKINMNDSTKFIGHMSSCYLYTRLDQYLSSGVAGILNFYYLYRSADYIIFIFPGFHRWILCVRSLRGYSTSKQGADVCVLFGSYWSQPIVSCSRRYSSGYVNKSLSRETSIFNKLVCSR